MNKNFLKINNEYNNYKSKSNDKFILFIINEDENFNRIKSQNVIRLMYLSTLLNYKSKEKNKNSADYYNLLRDMNNDIIIRKNLKNVLGLSDRVVTDFLSDVESHKYLIKSNIINPNDNKVIKGYVLNLNTFVKGELKKSEKNSYIRIYIKVLQDLYHSISPSHHKYVGYIFKALPYLNREWNILCWNTYETDLHKITPLPVKDFCNIIGYSTHNKSQLLNELSGITLNYNKQSYAMIKYRYNDKINNDMIIINPYLCYAGIHPTRADVINFFNDFIKESE